MICRFLLSPAFERMGAAFAGLMLAAAVAVLFW